MGKKQLQRERRPEYFSQLLISFGRGIETML
jgi:hypothetical protein